MVRSSVCNQLAKGCFRQFRIDFQTKGIGCTLWGNCFTVPSSLHNGVRRVLARWMRYDVIALDEVGYVPLAEIGAEFLFQVIAERAERASLIVTHESAVLGVDASVSKPETV